MAIEKKIKADELGKFAEEMACQEYIKKGFAILERRWRCGKNEIDVIAQKDNVLAVIEVKARSGKDEDPLSAVTRDKRRRMVRMADAYLKQMPGQMEYRLDIVTLTGSKEKYELEILENAFVAADLF